MLSYEYHKDSFKTFEEGRRLEWAITNGIGGYAGSSLIGSHTRTHQGYLIASLHPPIERYLVFSKINEALVRSDGHGNDTSISLETSQHKRDGKTQVTGGFQYLSSFSYDGSAHYLYQAGDITLRKHITLKQGENVCAVGYEIENCGSDAALSLVPLFNFREHNTLATRETLRFSDSIEGLSFRLRPLARPDISILFQTSEGAWEQNAVCFDEQMQLPIEVEQETEGLDCHYCPVTLTVSLPAGCKKKLSLLCTVCGADDILPDITADTAFLLKTEREAYTRQLYRTAGYGEGRPISVSPLHAPETDKNQLACQLVLAADQFLSRRDSTGLKTVLAGLPWFTDWGRDTMIAFTGLTLSTGRVKEAEEILLTFSRYIKNGIVPNMFPDDNMPPLYNTADASLWYFYAVWQYLEAVHSPKADGFIRDNIYPHLKEIIAAYKDGTDFCIYMDTDGLIHAGSDLDQITWMDVRVGEWVVTPRHGKPVEINALWYNALKIMEQLSERFSDPDSVTSEYRALGAQARASFREKFWNEKMGCLYDVADSENGGPDDSLRPNQIYAVSLPFSILPREMELSIVAVVERELYAGCGLRSLSRDHADYHGIYNGSLPKRDAAYHQGTAWGFLLGGFLTAYLKVHDHEKEHVLRADMLLDPIREHLTGSGCIGSVSEIFDGDAPHHPRGCYAQAWSVGEVLRAYTQDILPYLD